VRILLLGVLFVLPSVVFALPIDWNGSIGFSTNTIQDVRGTSDDCTAAAGSQCTDNDNQHARFQNYVIKLRPNMIVSDSATIKAEVRTGMQGHTFAGEDTELTTPSLHSQSYAGNSGLYFSQFYAELYADTALFRVGKYAKDFGLGAMINSGKDSWDRYLSLYDGFEAEFQIGKFTLTPIWSKMSSPSSPSSNKPNSGKYDATEMAISGVYLDSNKNLEFGIYYGKREAERNTDLLNTNDSINLSMTDIYIKKSWSKFSLGLEVPMLTGEVGKFYNTAEKEDIKSTSFIAETSYQFSEKFMMGFDAGMIKGEDGKDDFSATYLHPNYQIARLMFRYNRQAFQDTTNTLDPFASSITNAQYFKLHTRYQSGAWAWSMAYIMATANEVAQNGDEFYDHSNKSFQTANDDQDDDLGYEVDLAFDYEWNPNIFIRGYFAYYAIGDYYNFLNDSTKELGMEKIMATGLDLSMTF
jgi:hypothetical protein